ncbi:cupredoxin domain-containing protein [Longispora sp. K20-0274]|uniref:plastocyanin/azurin family copper-binding protein n=1 Tax=Longispora sp. K20-0274 TaxID=3088255 RepID=UPI00399B9BD4
MSTSLSRLRLVAVSGCVAVALAGCGNSHPAADHPAGSTLTASSAPVVASGDTTVEVKDFTFTPQNLSVPVGAKVTWKFDDGAKHNVKASDGSFASADLNNGATYSFTFTKTGTFPYICGLHQFMTATITVR